MKDLLDRDSAVPLYTQIENVFRGLLSSGEWWPGKRIPSESGLQKDFGVSRMTVRGVLNVLADEGLLHRVPGKGTFVSTDKIVTHSPAYKGIREQLEERGIKTKTELIELNLAAPGRSVSTAMDLGSDGRAHRVIRRRLVDGLPVTLHESWVHPGLAPGLGRYDVVERQLCEILSTEYGLNAKRTEETLQIVSATDDEASLLECEPGAPLLLLKDVLTDEQGRVFELTKLLMRGDRMKLKFQFDS